MRGREKHEDMERQGKQRKEEEVMNKLHLFVELVCGEISTKHLKSFLLKSNSVLWQNILNTSSSGHLSSACLKTNTESVFLESQIQTGDVLYVGNVKLITPTAHLARLSAK